MGEKFESWAIVELFGHQKVAGQVSEQQIAGQAMLRVDVPEMEGQAGWTRFYGGNAVYSITPADEATTRAAAAMLQARPITVYGVAAPERQIGARLVDGDGYPQGFLDPEEDDDYLDEDGVDDEDDRSYGTVREQVVDEMRHLLASEPVFLDVETTGLDETAEVIEIAVMDVQGVVLFDRLIRPQKPIPPEASAVHGITNEMVAEAPTFGEVIDELAGIVRGRVMIFYKAEYDLQALRQSAAACGVAEWNGTHYAGSACAMEMYADFYGERDEYHPNCRWQKLVDATEQQGIALPEGLAPHRALADAALTRRLCLKMAGEWDGR